MVSVRIATFLLLGLSLVAQPNPTLTPEQRADILHCILALHPIVKLEEGLTKARGAAHVRLPKQSTIWARFITQSAVFAGRFLSTTRR